MAGQVELVVSYDLLLELESVLLRDKFRKKLTVADVLSYVSYLREHATFIPARQIERSPEDPAVPDPEDEYLVHLAQDAQVDRIVSGDPDFRGLSQAETPREFIDALLYTQQERLHTTLPEYYRTYFVELRSQLERPDVFDEAVPEHMRGYKRVISVCGRDGLLVVHVPIEKEIIFTERGTGKRLEHFPAELSADDDRFEFIQFPEESVGVLANFIGGGEEIDLDIPTNTSWGIKGFSSPQQRIDTSGEVAGLSWEAPWTRLVAADFNSLHYFEDLERAKAEAWEDVEPYIQQGESP
jgi:predicted nucleic acid-binding protein